VNRPTVVIGIPADVVDGRTVTGLIDVVPDAPFALGGVTVAAIVASEDDAAIVLDAVLRGASAIIDMRLDAVAEARFLDQLGRIADVRRGLGQLAETEDYRLLDLLKQGLSLGAAAGRLGMSRRTADRRMATLRSTLGVTTNAEAVARLNPRSAADR
jgi:DNA-binding NarL/FixJ family response regulator